MLNVPEGAQSVLKAERVVVIIVGLDETSLAGLKIFFGVHVVRVLLDLVGFGLFAVVDALLQVVLDDVHLGDDALDAYQLVCHLATETSGSDEVPSKIALEADPVVLELGIELRALVSEETPFEMVFGESIIFLGVLDQILGSLRVLLSEKIDVDPQSMGIGEWDSGDELVVVSLVVLDFHLAHNTQLLNMNFANSVTALILRFKSKHSPTLPSNPELYKTAQFVFSFMEEPLDGAARLVE